MAISSMHLACVFAYICVDNESKRSDRKNNPWIYWLKRNLFIAGVIYVPSSETWKQQRPPSNSFLEKEDGPAKPTNTSTSTSTHQPGTPPYLTRPWLHWGHTCRTPFWDEEWSFTTLKERQTCYWSVASQQIKIHTFPELCCEMKPAVGHHFLICSITGSAGSSTESD